MPEDASYPTLREAILRYERIQFKWGTKNGTDSLFLGTKATSANDEPTPMEIDRIKGKGKGKGKDSKGGKQVKGDKPKGKGQQQWNASWQGQGKGYQQSWSPGWQSKGKDKGKGRGKDKGAQRETRACNICHKAGHLAKDCWSNPKSKGKVNQVQGEQANQPNNASQGQAQQPNNVSSGSNQAAQAVRRVQIFDLSSGEPVLLQEDGSVRAVSFMESPQIPKPSRIAQGQVQVAVGAQGQVQVAQSTTQGWPGFRYVCCCIDGVAADSRAIAQATGPLDCTCVRAVSEGHRAKCPQVAHRVASWECHAMDITDHDQNWTLCPELKAKLQDHAQVHALSGATGQVCAVSGVRAVSYGSQEHDVILDSGADWSCLPLEYAEYGVKSPDLGLGLSDAQGSGLAVRDFRDVEFLLETADGDQVVWKDTCAITNVTQPLLCEGKLMRGGWWPSPGDKGKAQHHMYIKHLESDLKALRFQCSSRATALVFEHRFSELEVR